MQSEDRGHVSFEGIWVLWVLNRCRKGSYTHSSMHGKASKAHAALVPLRKALHQPVMCTGGMIVALRWWDTGSLNRVVCAHKLGTDRQYMYFGGRRSSERKGTL